MGDEKHTGRLFDAVAYANFVIEGMATKLERAGRDEARTKALWLINHVTGVPFGEIATRGIKPMIKEQWDELGALLDRVIAGEPVQYVVGNTDFMGRVFKCDGRALIPRPETEELVAAVVKVVRARYSPQRVRIVDVGTGTGCIAISLALDIPEARIIATDISTGALALARENALALMADVDLQQMDLLSGCEPSSADIIVSNPPYIADGETSSLATEVRDHEPIKALFAGADGLDVFRRLVPQSFGVLRPDGSLFLEIGETQAHAVKQMLLESGFFDVTAHKDLAGHDRIVHGRRPLV